ncbi:MAG: CoA transferase [Alphaproteobacteria bacterium]|jgi:crotonobetainyl-CoA:carnitine CoA-transferase CaiB-like acyl-CoA transferase|nr:CoA transferase [Alphaproteobacteria bacterium]MDP6254264.1 CoA transferase [Alphaproteobacteria bacterium]MDP7054606.1 CoA transferase [Alphaproteobacteria bacterium]MDP7227119.1 CoA transferase [Alphaproteobacteria bacterium]MDP7462525.1 CoA transferase [Alphaproteobacteria bacterium]|tara:strand:- start:5170 stop:6366 length:1197 start_codon:yes stop_codon:yes gene_type:complete
MSGPLQGIRVLDIATILAAPLAGTLMADFGADVVKAELPGTGDGLRNFPPFKDGKSVWWKAANRNKNFITLDLRKPEGAELLLKMLPKFDVLLENFRTGTLAKWGLDKETLWKANPNLIILRATAFGQTGPYATKPGFARIFEAMSGLAYITGDPDRSPMHNGYPIGDAIGGLTACNAVLMSLLGRERGTITGGEEIDLSLTEATFRLLDSMTIQYDQLGEEPQRTGNASHYSAPANVFRTSDGQYVSLSGSTQATFVGNAKAIDRPDLLEDPKFDTNQTRFANREEINEIYTEWFATHTQPEAIAAFEREQGTLAPIYSVAQVFEDPQFAAREAIVPVQDDDFGEVRLQAVIPKLTNNPGQVRHTARSLGADNLAVYEEYLDLNADEVSALQEKGII